MKVIPVTYLALIRARKEMSGAYARSDWHAVQEWDQLVAEALSQAFDDPQRDHRLLSKELEHILALYGEMVKEMPNEAVVEWQKPELVV